MEDSEADDNILEACHILHSGRSKTISKRAKASKDDSLPACFENEPLQCGHWRKLAFHSIWEGTEKLVKNTVEEQYVTTFKEIEGWITSKHFCDAQLNLYSGVKPARLNTGIVFSGALDSSDGKGIFGGLATYMKGQDKYHVAQLLPRDFPSKGGINNPLRTLFKQFIELNPETTDMEILVAWYQELKCKKPSMVVIVEDAEHLNGSALADLIVILSEWVEKLPFVLILGMSTTGESLRHLLPAGVIGRLQIQCFSMKPPLEQLEAVVRAVFFESPYLFCLSHNVIQHMYDYFLTHDNSLTSFLRFLKISCMEHFCKQPLSFLCDKLLSCTSQIEIEEVCRKLPSELLNYASNLPSLKDFACQEVIWKSMAEALWKFKSQRQNWKVTIECFNEAAKQLGFEFADVFSAALDPSAGANSTFVQIILKLRDSPVSTLTAIVERWNSLKSVPEDIRGLQQSVNELSEELKTPPTLGGYKQRSPSMSCSRRVRSLMGQTNNDREPSTPQTRSTKPRSNSENVRKRAMDLLENMQRNYLVVNECLPFHEIVCFKETSAVKEAMCGESGKRMHMDLTESKKYIKCNCCPSDTSLSTSLHDTAIAYNLSLEHNELVNVHDWFQSFHVISSGGDGSGKKRKYDEKACVQARFCGAVAELNYIGLVRLAKKRTPDVIQRAVFKNLDED